MKRFLLKRQKYVVSKHLPNKKNPIFVLTDLTRGMWELVTSSLRQKPLCFLLLLHLLPTLEAGKEKFIFSHTQSHFVSNPFGRSNTGACFFTQKKISHRNPRMTHYFCFPLLTLHFLLLQQTQSLCVHFSLYLLRERVFFFLLSKCA